MRKMLFSDQKDKSILIVQDIFYKSLDPIHKEGFKKFQIQEKGIVVRDDPAATVLYYKFLPRNSQVNSIERGIDESTRREVG
jgi:hypothetical protein